MRYLGFIPSNLLDPPQNVVRLLAYQLGVSPEAINVYGQREQTKSDHLLQIMQYLGYRRASVDDMKTLEAWLVSRALEHDIPTFLLHTATQRLYFFRILRPGLTILEQMVSVARQRAREITFEQVLPLLSPQRKRFLDNLLVPEGGRRDTVIGVPPAATESGSRTTLSWLQRMPNDHTAPQILATLEKIRFLQNASVLNWELETINPNRLKFLANIGARATNQQMQRAVEMRRYPVLIAFLKQTLFLMTDIVIDLFDACLWQRHTDAKKELDEMRLLAARSTNEKLRTYNEVVKILIDSEVKDAAVRAKVFRRFNRGYLQQVVEETETHLRPRNDEAIDLFAQRYGYIRQFAPCLIETLIFKSYQPASSLLDAIKVLKALNASGQRAVPKDAPTAFITDAWRDYVVERNGNLNRRYYELAVLWELRQALRSGDVFVEHARRYADSNTYLIPRQDWPLLRQEVIRLTGTPATGETRLMFRVAELQSLTERVETLHADSNSWLRTENGKWVLTPLSGEEKPASAQTLSDAIAQRLPRLDITDLLIEVDQWTHFSRHFRHSSTQSPLTHEHELEFLYAGLIAQGGNFSLAQMSRMSGLAHHQLIHTSTWFIHSDTLKAANTELVNYHHGLDISRTWGAGTLSSSDGQRFPVSGKNPKARSVLRDFGYRRGVTFYTWTSDQLSLYGGKAVVSTVRDATYVLDEILANETELPIIEHTTDTSGYTEIVFALFDLLGLTFTPRIKDLSDQQLYRTDAMDLSRFPKVKARLNKRLNTRLFLDMWDEMLRLVGSLKLGWVTASLVIEKLQASKNKGELAKALQEYGRLIKGIFA